MSIDSKGLPKRIFQIKSMYGEGYEGIKGISLSPSGKYLLLKKTYWESENIEFIDLNNQNMVLSNLNIRGKGFFDWVGNSDRVLFFNYTADVGYEEDIEGNTTVYDLDLNSRRKIHKKEYKLCYPIYFDWDKRYFVCKVPGKKKKIFQLYDNFNSWEKVFNKE